MALSDCPKCWNTPCDCGHDYKDWSVESLEKMAAMFNGLIAEKLKTPSELPKKIIRVDDGMEFILNEDTKQYRIHLGIPHLDDAKHLHNEYSYERLMNDSRSQGKFKVADGTEDVEVMKKSWVKRFEGNNDGHGNEDE